MVLIVVRIVVCLVQFVEWLYKFSLFFLPFSFFIFSLFNFYFFILFNFFHFFLLFVLLQYVFSLISSLFFFPSLLFFFSWFGHVSNLSIFQNVSQSSKFLLCFVMSYFPGKCIGYFRVQNRVFRGCGGGWVSVIFFVLSIFCVRVILGVAWAC